MIYFYRSALTWLAISPFTPYPPPLQTFYSSCLKGKKRLVTPLTATQFLYTTLTYIGSHFTKKTPTQALLTTKWHVRFEISCSPLCPRILLDWWLLANNCKRDVVKVSSPIRKLKLNKGTQALRCSHCFSRRYPNRYYSDLILICIYNISPPHPPPSGLEGAKLGHKVPLRIGLETMPLFWTKLQTIYHVLIGRQLQFGWKLCSD